MLLLNNLDYSYNKNSLEELDFKGTQPTSGFITISKMERKFDNNFVCNYGDGVSSWIGIDDI